MTRCSDADKVAGLKRAIEKAQAAKDALADDAASNAYSDFMKRYTFCEVAYKSLLVDFKKANDERVKEEDLKVDWRELQRVLKRYGIDPRSSTIKAVFDGTRAIGKRNARGLRNSLAHSPNKEALDELATKRREIFDAMDGFLRMLIDARDSNEGRY